MIFSLLLFQTVAITGGTIHTMEADAKPFVGTVLIENSYISAVGKNVTVPAGAQIVDAGGMHVLPGLIDGYVNHDPDHDILYISAGVTLVRDTGNEHTRILAETDRNARDRTPGPALWVAGAVLDGSPPATRAVVLLDTVDDVTGKLPRMFEDGVAYLSFHRNLTLEPWKKVLELAHAQHLQVWGPLPSGVTLEAVLEAGQDGIYNLDPFLPAGVTWDKLTEVQIEEIAKRVGAQKVGVTPTLALYAKRVVKPKDNEKQLDYLSPYYVETWKRELAWREKQLVTKEFLESAPLVVAAQGKLVAALFAHGCRIVPGSGTPNPWLFPGTALLDELSLLRGAGFRPAEIVRLATAAAAETIGATKRGTITVGKVGDVVLTAADPLQDIGNLYRPAVVVARGLVLDRAEIDKRVDALAATQQRVRETLSKPLVVAEPELPAGDVVLTGSVETTGIGTRVSAEKYAVVRRYDGSLTYCGRVVVPGEATRFSTETTVQQTIQNNDLVEFDVVIKSGTFVTEVHGAIVAGKMAIEQRRNDAFIGLDNVNDRLAFVDCGSVTSLLVLGYHRPPGVFKVLAFDDYSPTKALWEMRLDQDALHVVQAKFGGEMRIAYDDVGGIREAKRTVGNGIVHTKLVSETKAVDGKGLPMPASKKDLAPKPVPAGKQKDG